MKNLALGLTKIGIRVTVLCGVPTFHLSSLYREPSQEMCHGIEVVRFPYPSIPPRHTFFQLSNFKRLCEYIEESGVDVVHGQSGSMFPTLLRIRNLTPVVVTFHCSPRIQMISSLRSITRGGSIHDFFSFGLGYPVWEYVFKKEFQESTANVAVSKTLMNELLQEIGDGRKSFSCIRNGIDLEMLDNACENKNNKEENDPVILFGGRLFWNKGVSSVLKLAYLLQKRSDLNLRIAIYGSGPLYQTILREIRRLDLNNVELKPFAPQTEFLSLMRRAMFVAVPGFYEACPMVLLECMCMGKIPLLFNNPFAREFTLDGRYGILANSVQDMVNRIKSLLHSGHVDKLESEIRSFSRRNYSIDVTASQYELLYKELCS